MIYRGLAFITILVVLVTVGVQLSKKKEVTESFDDEEESYPIKKKSIRPDRTPASTPRPLVQDNPTKQFEGPTYQTSDLSREIFDEKSELPETSSGDTSSSYSNPSYSPPYNPQNFSRPNSYSNSSPSNSKSSGPKAAASQPFGGSYVAYNTPPVGAGKTTSGSNTGGTTSGTSTGGTSGSSTGGGVVVTPPVPETLSCTASTGNGTYSYTFSVNLTCSTAATIEYCISEGACCDPRSGSTYSTPLPINMGAGSYCLSFIGENSNGTQSVVENRMYTLNPEVPDLQVAHQKKYFQTTELNGTMSVTSENFGDASMSVGVINLKNHNPDPSDLNWNCNEIVSHHSTLSAPATSLIMADSPANLFSLNTQIDIFLRPLNLVYGTNNLTSYIRNNNYVETIAACSTTQVVLEDFDFFDPSPFTGVPGNNDVREFSGGFTHLGFYEPESTVFRGPAGSSTESVSEQEMESNLFDIFY